MDGNFNSSENSSFHYYQYNLKSDLSTERESVPNRNFKLRLKYVFTILITIFSLIGVSLFYFSITNITSPMSSEKLGYDFNLTKFTIIKSNTTCLDKSLITPNSIQHYKSSVSKYGIIYTVNFCFQILSFLLSLFSLIIFNFLIKNERCERRIKRILFWAHLVVVILDYLIVILFLTMIAKFMIIISFIKKNTERKCIVMLTWDFMLKFLTEQIQFIMLLSLLRAGNLLQLTYQLRMLIVFNNYFLTPEESQNNSEKTIRSVITRFEEESSSETEMNVLSNFKNEE